MKKYFPLLFSFILLYLLCGAGNINAQQDINLEYVITQNPDNPDNIDITVTAINGLPNFIFRLYDGDFMEDGQLVEVSNSITEVNYIFKNQPKAEFMICVSDRTTTTVCKMIPLSLILNENISKRQ